MISNDEYADIIYTQCPVWGSDPWRSNLWPTSTIQWHCIVSWVVYSVWSLGCTLDDQRINVWLPFWVEIILLGILIWGPNILSSNLYWREAVSWVTNTSFWCQAVCVVLFCTLVLYSHSSMHRRSHKRPLDIELVKKYTTNFMTC